MALISVMPIRGVTASVFTETPTPTGKIKKHLLPLPVLSPLAVPLPIKIITIVRAVMTS